MTDSSDLWLTLGLATTVCFHIKCVLRFTQRWLSSVLGQTWLQCICIFNTCTHTCMLARAAVSAKHAHTWSSALPRVHVKTRWGIQLGEAMERGSGIDWLCLKWHTCNSTVYIVYTVRCMQCAEWLADVLHLPKSAILWKKWGVLNYKTLKYGTTCCLNVRKFCILILFTGSSFVLHCTWSYLKKKEHLKYIRFILSSNVYLLRYRLRLNNAKLY